MTSFDNFSEAQVKILKGLKRPDEWTQKIVKFIKNGGFESFLDDTYLDDEDKKKVQSNRANMAKAIREVIPRKLQEFEEKHFGLGTFGKWFELVAEQYRFKLEDEDQLFAASFMRASRELNQGATFEQVFMALDGLRKHTRGVEGKDKALVRELFIDALTKFMKLPTHTEVRLRAMTWDDLDWEVLQVIDDMDDKVWEAQTPDESVSKLVEACKYCKIRGGHRVECQDYTLPILKSPQLTEKMLQKLNGSKAMSKNLESSVLNFPGREVSLEKKDAPKKRKTKASDKNKWFKKPKDSLSQVLIVERNEPTYAEVVANGRRTCDDSTARNGWSESDETLSDDSCDTVSDDSSTQVDGQKESDESLHLDDKIWTSSVSTIRESSSSLESRSDLSSTSDDTASTSSRDGHCSESSHVGKNTPNRRMRRLAKRELRRQAQELHDAQSKSHEFVSLVKHQVQDDDLFFMTVDSAASVHVLQEKYKDLLPSTEGCDRLVEVADGGLMTAKEKGSGGIFKDVLILKATSNLLSTAKLIEEGCHLHLGLSGYIKRGKTKIPLKKKNGFFYLSKKNMLRMMKFDSVNALKTTLVDKYAEAVRKLSEDPVTSLHRALGHLNLDRVKELVNSGLIEVSNATKDLLEKTDSIHCPVCLECKMKKSPAGDTLDEDVQVPFQRVGIDYVDYNLAVSNGFVVEGMSYNDRLKGVFIMIDYATSFMLATFVRSKSETALALCHLMQFASSRGYKVIELRSDSGKELLNRQALELLSVAGIHHSVSTPGTQSQNGKIERAIQTVMAASRCMIKDAGVNGDKWLLAVRHATHIVNMIPKQGQAESPTQLLNMRTPNLRAMPLFWQPGVAKVPTQVKGLADRGEPCNFAFFDYARDQKRFWVVLKATNQLVMREKVVFLKQFKLMNSNTDATEEIHLSQEVRDPKSIEEALESEDAQAWLEALKNEAESLIEHSTFEEIRGYVEQKIVPCFILFKRTISNEGEVKFKARLVALGNLQKFNPEENIFAPTCSFDVNFLMDNIALHFDLETTIMDIKSAFLKGVNDRLEFVSVPKRFAELMGFERSVLRLRGNLYGTRQAPSIWFKTFEKALLDIGLTQTASSPTLFFEGDLNSSDFIMLSIYVDDIKIVHKGKKLFVKFAKKMEQVFPQTKISPDFVKILGVEYKFSEGVTEVHHREYLLKHLDDKAFGGSGAEHLPKLATGVAKRSDCSTMVRKYVGILRFAVDRARPDMMYHVSDVLSMWISNPEGMMSKICKFARATADRGLTFRKSSTFGLFGFADASHVRNGDGKSRLAGCLYTNLESGCFTAFSKNTSVHFTTVSISSCESEIKAIYEMAIMVEYFDNLCLEVGIILKEVPVLFTDNKSAIQVVNNNTGGHPLRHLNVRIAYIAHRLKLGRLRLEYVETSANRSDILTKYLPKNDFDRMSKLLLG